MHSMELRCIFVPVIFETFMVVLTFRQGTKFTMGWEVEGEWELVFNGYGVLVGEHKTLFVVSFFKLLLFCVGFHMIFLSRTFNFIWILFGSVD